MAAETRNDAIDRWMEDDRLRKMSENDLERHMEGEAKKLDTERRIEERNDYWHAAFVTFDVPSSIAPDGGCCIKPSRKCCCSVAETAASAGRRPDGGTDAPRVTDATADFGNYP
jgi:hypothetical protein